MTSQIATAEPLTTEISATGTAPEAPGPLLLAATAENAPVSLAVNWANPGPPALAALPPGTTGGETGTALFKTLATETNRRTPAGTLLNRALSGVPKSVRPAVCPPTVPPMTKPDSE